jgi:hypothetical protein
VWATLGVVVITKKLSKGMDVKLLSIIYKRYTKVHGYGTRHLDQFKVILTAGELFTDDMPEIVEFDPDTNTQRYLLIDILKELLAQGYVEKSDDNKYYWLTEAGYDFAAKSKFEHFVTYLNNNSGWALPIAFISLLVSIVALYTS